MVNTLFDGRFRVDGEIAKNDRAWIYHGQDLKSGKPVAVKVLRPWTMPKDKLEDRFEQEFQLLQALNHPNIVQVIQTGMTPTNFHYFAMELLQGKTLSRLLAEQGRLSPQAVGLLLDQIASAVDAAHAKNVVHRDINPSNIMLHSEQPGKQVVKILDFGLAKLIQDGENDHAGLTLNGMSVGTPAYMSPEQAMGQPVGPAADIYSLGVTLYKLLTGAVPYDKPSEYATMLAHVSEPFPAFITKGITQAMVPGLIEDVVKKAMAKTPAERPRTATELARLYRAALSAEESSSSPGLTQSVSSINSSSNPSRPAVAAASSPYHQQQAAAPMDATASRDGLANRFIPLLVFLGVGIAIGGIVLALR